MLFHAFLSGLGIALSYTVILTLIVDSHSVHSLPFLYITTSVLLLLVGFVYSKLEHKYQPSSLFKWVLMALSIWGIIMLISLKLSDSFEIIALAFCTYYVVYYLSNLEYWGSAALIFNVRQGKRLFSLLSVCESLAKIMGYALTPLIISTFDISSVFLIVALSFGAALLIFRRLSKIYKTQMVLAHHDRQHDNKSGTVITRIKIGKIFKSDTFNIYISIFAVISTLTYFLTHYAFLLRIEEQYINLEDIAVFIATLFSLSKLLNLFIKVFLCQECFKSWALKWSCCYFLFYFSQ